VRTPNREGRGRVGDENFGKAMNSDPCPPAREESNLVAVGPQHRCRIRFLRPHQKQGNYETVKGGGVTSEEQLAK